MFLALREIKKEKLRSGLIIAMIVLISYLIFILTSLALGLARENTDALDSWGTQTVILSKDANIQMGQSLLSSKQVDDSAMTKEDALVGQATVVAKASGHEKLSAVFLGLRADDFIAKNLTLTSGHKPTSSRELVVDEAFKDAGYKLGDTFKLNSQSRPYTIVGFTKNAKMNIAPVVYGQLSAWAGLKNLRAGWVGSAIVSRKKVATSVKGLAAYTRAKFVSELPGYSAQNMTFELMIGFLMIISLIIIAVFLYILTIQKLPNYAVMRVQGIPSRVLVGGTLSQALLLVGSGLVIGVLLTVITAVAMPAAVPMAFDVPILAAVGAGLLVMAVIGALLPARSVLKVDPMVVIGG
ncbi:ABC transporter permease [Lacticaseibacillus yichunensis]|uniref:Putative hemin transport system permease protein HrtB n=3 Tax=Bacilli TaxID=91061 RepID=A0ABW4CQ89_9LACO